VFLDEQLQLEVTRGPLQDFNIIVLQADDRPFGLVVDAIRDTEEIVVKPLQKQLKGINVFAGAAIMGDGRVALVLDVLGLAQRASVLSSGKRRALSEHESPVAPAVTESHALLFFEPRQGGQMAIPLSLVARLEEFPRAKLENLGVRQVVQYRGEIMPLIDVSQELEHLRCGGLRTIAPQLTESPSQQSSALTAMGVEAATEVEDETIPVVVCTNDDQHVGLMVGKILDIVHDPITARSRASRPGVLFTAVVQERVTEFVDVAALVREVMMDSAESTNWNGKG
jgi:two-component system chemotaxis sensor kinase CheA